MSKLEMIPLPISKNEKYKKLPNPNDTEKSKNEMDNELVFLPEEAKKAKENLSETNSIDYDEKAIKIVERVKNGVFGFGKSIYNLSKAGLKLIDIGVAKGVKLSLKSADFVKNSWSKYNEFCEEKMAEPINNFTDKTVSNISKGATNIKDNTFDFVDYRTNQVLRVAETGLEMGGWLCTKGIDNTKLYYENTRDSLSDAKDNIKDIPKGILSFLDIKKRQINEIRNKYALDFGEQKTNLKQKVEEIKSNLAIRIIEMSQGYIDKRVKSDKVKSSLLNVFNEIKESYGWKNEDLIEQESLKWFESRKENSKEKNNKAEVL